MSNLKLIAAAFTALLLTAAPAQAAPTGCELSEPQRAMESVCESHVGCRLVTSVLNGCEAHKKFYNSFGAHPVGTALSDAAINDAIVRYSGDQQSASACLWSFNKDNCSKYLGKEIPAPVVIAAPVETKPNTSYNDAVLRRRELGERDAALQARLALDCKSLGSSCPQALQQLDVLLADIARVNADPEYLSQLPPFQNSSLDKATRLGWVKLGNNWSNPTAEQARWQCNGKKREITEAMTVAISDQVIQQLSQYENQCLEIDEEARTLVKQWKGRIEANEQAKLLAQAQAQAQAAAQAEALARMQAEAKAQAEAKLQADALAAALARQQALGAMPAAAASVPAIALAAVPTIAATIAAPVAAALAPAIAAPAPPALAPVVSAPPPVAAPLVLPAATVAALLPASPLLAVQPPLAASPAALTELALNDWYNRQKELQAKEVLLAEEMEKAIATRRQEALHADANEQAALQANLSQAQREQQIKQRAEELANTPVEAKGFFGNLIDAAGAVGASYTDMQQLRNSR